MMSKISTLTKYIPRCDHINIPIFLFCFCPSPVQCVYCKVVMTSWYTSTSGGCHQPPNQTWPGWTLDRLAVASKPCQAKSMQSLAVSGQGLASEGWVVGARGTSQVTPGLVASVPVLPNTPTVNQCRRHLSGGKHLIWLKKRFKIKLTHMKEWN